jgi:hypothetical protein
LLRRQRELGVRWSAAFVANTKATISSVQFVERLKRLIERGRLKKETLRHFRTEPEKKGTSPILETPRRNTVAIEIFGLDASSSAAI